MKLFKNLFKKKTKVVEEQVLTTQPQIDYSHLPKCNFCGNYVHSHEQRKKISDGYGKKSTYHIKCFRRQLKSAKQAALSSSAGNLMNGMMKASKS